MTRYTLAPDLIAGLQALGQRWERITAAATPAARAAMCHAKKRQAIAQAAYDGTPEQAAEMRVAQKTGDTDAIDRLAEAGMRRAGDALGAFDRVFGGDGSAEAVGPSGGAGLGVGE